MEKIAKTQQTLADSANFQHDKSQITIIRHLLYWYWSTGRS